MSSIFKKLSYYLAVGAFLASTSPANSMLEFSSSMDHETADQRAVSVHPAVLTVKYGGEPLTAEQITTTLERYVVDHRPECIDIALQKFTCLRFLYEGPEQVNQNAPLLIRSLGASLGATVNTIIMNNNRLDTEGSTPEIGRYFPHLTSLDVSNNKVTGHLPTLLRRLQGKSILQTLELGNCDLCAEDVIYLRDAHPSLVTLDLSNNQTLRGNLSDMLLGNLDITLPVPVDIYQNINALKDFFINTSPFPNLKVLVLSDNPFYLIRDYTRDPNSYLYLRDGGNDKPENYQNIYYYPYRHWPKATRRDLALRFNYEPYWHPSLRLIDITNTPASRNPIPSMYTRGIDGEIAFINTSGNTTQRNRLVANSVLLEQTLQTLCDGYPEVFGPQDEAEIDGRPLARLMLQHVLSEGTALSLRIAEGYHD